MFFRIRYLFGVSCVDLFCRMYHHATVAVLLSRSWRVRKRAQQAIRKLLSSLGGSSFAHGLLGELRVVINKHKVQKDDFYSVFELPFHLLLPRPSDKFLTLLFYMLARV